MILEGYMAESNDQNPGDRPGENASRRMRLDLVKMAISIDEQSGTVVLGLVPDPRRYDSVEREGGSWYLDRYFQTLFRLEDFAEAPMAGLPLYASDRTIDSAPEYAARRRDAILSELKTGQHQPPDETPRTHGNLVANDTEREIAFISVDICGSTAYRRRDPKGFDQAYKIFMQELGTVVGHFQGSLLKATGDGFIAYVDGPGFNVLVDNAIDLGGSLIRVLDEAINPEIVAHGLEALSIRVGADFGTAVVGEVRIASTGFVAIDVTSDALNRSVKIEQSAHPNTFRIGYELYRLAHVQWLERSFAVKFDGDSVGIPDYQVFEVR